MTAICTDFVGSICKHVNSVSRHYVDFGPRLVGALSAVTVSSATATCAADTALTIGAPAVVSTQTVVPTKTGTRTIAANQGVSFLLSAGTAIAETAEPVRIKVSATMNNGEIWVGNVVLRVSE